MNNRVHNRREELLNKLRLYEVLSINELAKMLQVSTSTIRTDLASLPWYERCKIHIAKGVIYYQ